MNSNIHKWNVIYNIKVQIYLYCQEDSFRLEVTINSLTLKSIYLLSMKATTM